MGKVKDICQVKHGQVKVLHDVRYSQVQIAKHTAKDISAVQNALRRSLESPQPGCTVRKTSAHDDSAIKRTVCIDPHISSDAVAHSMGDGEVKVSSRTVRRRLPAKLPLMMEKQRLARLKFCRQYKSKSAEWWHGVMFTAAH